MALARPLPPLWQTLLPGLNGPMRPVLHMPFLQRLTKPFGALSTPFGALAIPSLSLPSIPSLAEIWDGILNAVPKKKTSYRKKRQRFMAGKGLKDITSLNTCSGCGRVKRLHILCPYCVDGECYRQRGLSLAMVANIPSNQNQHLRPNKLVHPPADREASQANGAREA
jgi:large subunit ribosomal protein L32